MFLCIISVLVSTAGDKTYSSAAATQLQDSMYPEENETVRQLLLFVHVHYRNFRRSQLDLFIQLNASQHNPPHIVFH